MAHSPNPTTTLLRDAPPPGATTRRRPDKRVRRACVPRAAPYVAICLALCLLFAAGCVRQTQFNELQTTVEEDAHYDRQRLRDHASRLDLLEELALAEGPERQRILALLEARRDLYVPEPALTPSPDRTPRPFVADAMPDAEEDTTGPTPEETSETPPAEPLPATPDAAPTPILPPEEPVAPTPLLAEEDADVTATPDATPDTTPEATPDTAVAAAPAATPEATPRFTPKPFDPSVLADDSTDVSLDDATASTMDPPRSSPVKRPVAAPTPRPTVAADMGPGPETPFAEPEEWTAPEELPDTASEPAEQPTPAGVRMADRSPRTLYSEAVQLTRQGDADRGRQLLEAFLMEHPDHELAPNAYYWLGETYYSDRRYAQAILTFKEVASRFPRHHKAAASMLKTGFAYERLGDTANARFYLSTLVDEYPGSDPAKLAKAALDERFQ